MRTEWPGAFQDSDAHRLKASKNCGQDSATKGSHPIGPFIARTCCAKHISWVPNNEEAKVM